MKNHCRESVGFSFRAPLCGFCGRRFCLCEVFCDQCYNSAFLLFSPSSVMILHFSFSFLFPCSFSSLRTKQLLVFELSVLCVCLFHCVIATEFDYRTTTRSELYCKQLIVWMLNIHCFRLQNHLFHHSPK